MVCTRNINWLSVTVMGRSKLKQSVGLHIIKEQLAKNKGKIWNWQPETPYKTFCFTILIGLICHIFWGIVLRRVPHFQDWTTTKFLALGSGIRLKKICHP